MHVNYLAVSHSRQVNLSVVLHSIQTSEVSMPHVYRSPANLARDTFHVRSFLFAKLIYPPLCQIFLYDSISEYVGPVTHYMNI